MEYQKAKSAPKQITVKGDALRKRILGTMSTVSAIVGATLGPSGNPVLIERFEHGLPPVITKDGVTVMRALGMNDATDHCIMEAARDAATKTANEAGDGTTTATILSESLVRYIDQYCKRNPHVSPQKVVRSLESAFRTTIEPTIQDLTISVKNNVKLQTSVAKISANNEQELANAVMDCFALVGDEGNVTIIERSGPTGYLVEELEGYPIMMGYEQSCAKYYSAFINDASTQKVVMDRPVFLLYHGVVNDIQPILPLLQKVGDELENKLQGRHTDYEHYNVVIVATGFSPRVLGSLAHASTQPNSIRMFPLVVPLTAAQNGQQQFLDDLAAVTGAVVFDPLTNPVDRGELVDLGPGTTSFEAMRTRSMIIGRAEGNVPTNSLYAKDYATYGDVLLNRVSEVEALLKEPNSEWDKIYLQERVGKLTGGIAKLHVIGSSNGELKEKRDRAEDAVCAVRGAIKHGCLPGGGWTLLKLCSVLPDSDPVVAEVLKPALMVPVDRLLRNCGFNDHDIKKILEPILLGLKDGKAIVYDAYEHRHGDPIELGVLDSTPAVLEAIRNAISIASQLGTLGGTVVFRRDEQFERTEAHNAQDFERNANLNEANQRA